MKVKKPKKLSPVKTRLPEVVTSQTGSESAERFQPSTMDVQGDFNFAAGSDAMSFTGHNQAMGRGQEEPVFKPKIRHAGKWTVLLVTGNNLFV